MPSEIREIIRNAVRLAEEDPVFLADLKDDIDPAVSEAAHALVDRLQAQVGSADTESEEERQVLIMEQAFSIIFRAGVFYGYDLGDSDQVEITMTLTRDQVAGLVQRQLGA